MQPILAESAPHRGRAVAFAVVLAVIAALAISQGRQHSRHRYHHQQLPRIGKCAQVHYASYVYTR